MAASSLVPPLPNRPCSRVSSPGATPHSGQLILDRGSSKGEAHGLVCFDDDFTVEDLPLAALKLVGLKTGLSST